MELIRKYGYIILIIVTITVPVILRSTGTGHFMYDAKKWAEPSFSGSNIITPANISLLKGDKLIIWLGSGHQKITGITGEEISMPADSVLSKKYISVIHRNKGAVILFSNDYSVSAKVWMIMSQAGFKNIYIYSTDPDNEVLKKEFRSDSLTRPE
jgi:hypothetical protein